VIDTPANVVVLDDLAFLPDLPPAYAQVEMWDPLHLHLLDWAATGGTVIVNPGQVEWTGEILAPQTITLTKWFHVEPCTWTQTLLQEELWLEGVELEQRPVVIHKLPPDLWIDSSYDPLVCPGAPGQFILDYGNLGGYENQVLVRNEFPPTAPFAFSTPPPDNEDPAGLWAEWLVGDLPQGAAGRITVTVAVTDNVLPGDVIAIYDWIYDHVGEPRDEVETQFTVGAPDVAVNPPALWAELCPDGTGTLPLAICNVGPCLLDWTLAELTPTLWLSVDPAAGVLPPGVCQTVTVSLNAAGLAPGDYLAGLVVDSNDPETPQVAVPVTLTVSSGAEILTVTTAIADLTVTFTAEVEGPEPLEYLWDFGDGVGTSTETNPAYTYAAAGCYTVTLDVGSPCGGDSWTGEVCVGQACDPPAGADFSWAPDEPIMGEVVYFTGTVAAGSAPIAYSWAFGDGDTGTGANPTHVYDAAGTYTVWMTATNDCGEDTATHDIVVVEGCVAPADVDFTWSPTSPLVGEAAHFTATVGMGTLPLDYAWDFGDGSGATGSPTVGYIYSGAGAFTVTVVVSNTCGSATMAHPLVVQAVGSGYAIYLPLVVRP